MCYYLICQKTFSRHTEKQTDHLLWSADIKNLSCIGFTLAQSISLLSRKLNIQQYDSIYLCTLQGSVNRRNKDTQSGVRRM